MSAPGEAGLTLEPLAPSAPQGSASAKARTEAAPRPPSAEPMARAASQSDDRAPEGVPIGGRSSGTRRPARPWMLAAAKQLATLGLALTAILMALMTWNYYVAA